MCFNITKSVKDFFYFLSAQFAFRQKLINMTELLRPSDALEQPDKLVQSATSPGLAATTALGIEAFEMLCFINLIYQTARELLHMVTGIMEIL